MLACLGLSGFDFPNPFRETAAACLLGHARRVSPPFPAHSGPPTPTLLFSAMTPAPSGP
jgi:hypothetical protein